MMLQTMNNQDIEETVTQQVNESLEDEIFLAVDKLQALCTVQSRLGECEEQVTEQVRTHYALVVEEHVGLLKRLLDKQFG